MSRASTQGIGSAFISCDTGAKVSRVGPAPGRGPRRPARRPASRRSLELIALRLFAEQGFDETTLEQIATEAGVSRRTYFRYFASKADLLWHAFDAEVTAVRQSLAGVPDDVPTMAAIRDAVVAAHDYAPDDVPEVRVRMDLIRSATSLSTSATAHYEAWEGAVAEFVGRRTGQPPDALLPQAVARATLATCRAAYDCWVAAADSDLRPYLERALGALAVGFDPDRLPPGT